MGFVVRRRHRAGWFAAAFVAVVAIAVPSFAEAKRNLYVGGNTSDNIAGFDLGADGSLTAITGSPFPSGQLMRGGLISPNGQLAYSANNGNIRGYTVNGTTGVLTQVVGPLTSGLNLRSIAFNQAGNVVYFPLREDDQIQAFSVASSAVLTAIGAPVAAGDQPNNPVVTPNGKFLYLTNFASDNLFGYSIDGTGALTLLPGFPIAGINGAQGAQVSPDGRFLFIGADVGDQVFVFQIDAAGALTAVAGSPFAAGNTPRSITLTGDGSRLFVANEGTDNVSAFAVGADGALTPVTGSPFAAGDGPTGAVVTPSGNLVYISNQNSNDISAYSVAADGVLTQITGSPFAAGVTAPETAGLFITPDQPPTASFTATPGQPGEATAFNGSGSTDSDGTVTRFDWDFGDGQTAMNAGPNPDHVYAEAGTFTAVLTVTDNEGCSTTQVWTGQTALCNGSAVARTERQVTVRDTEGPNLKLSGDKKQKLAKSVEVTAKSNEPADAVAKGNLSVKGGSKGSKMALKSFKLKKTEKRLKAGKKTTLKLKLPKKGFKSAKAALAEGGKDKAKITVTATDDAGHESTAKFTVKLKPKR